MDEPRGIAADAPAILPAHPLPSDPPSPPSPPHPPLTVPYLAPTSANPDVSRNSAASAAVALAPAGEAAAELWEAVYWDMVRRNCSSASSTVWLFTVRRVSSRSGS